MEDHIIRGMAADRQVRFFAAYTKDVVEKARSIHNTSPVATAALGRLLTAGAMMGAMNKNPDDLVTLQIQCGGPIGGLCVTADARANVKGYVHQPDVMLPVTKAGKLDVGGALGSGVLSVVRDVGLKDPYVGQTNLVSGEIAEDLTYYFATSEQIPTSVALGVLMNRNNTVAHAGGFILQMMPFAQEDVIASLERKIAGLGSVTSFLKEGKTPRDLMDYLFEGYDLEINDTMPTRYACNCSKERVAKALISIGKKDLLEMIEDGKPVHVNCHFCGTDYEFSIGELRDLIGE